MNISNIPRTYLLGIILVMVGVLIVITVINPGSLVFKDQTDYAAQKKTAEEQTKQYEALLASVAPDYQASQQLLQKIASEDIVRQEVESTLNVNQKVNIPTIETADLMLSQRNDRAEVANYVSKLGSIINNYNDDTEAKITQAFTDNADVSALNAATARTQSLTESLRSLAVPKDAIETHKAYLAAYQTYGSFLTTASQYANGQNTQPWDSVYGQYEVIDNRLGLADAELNKLSQKYALEVPLPSDLALNNAEAGQGIPFVKTAQAQFIPASLVIDIKAAVEVGIKAGLARAFAKFAVSMLDKLVAHIEKNFAIASQLYYSQDLGRYYSVEYMKKFVSDPLDQDIIQKFLPQYFCLNASKADMKKIFTAKAAANQGSDIVIDPADPQFLNKLARLGGDEKNYSDWWEDYYTGLAATTQQQAESAATKEVISPGLKSGRDLIDGQINKTMASIFQVQEAAISGTISLGTNNADNIVSQLVAGVVENMVNKFVFTPIGGGASGSGGIGVIAEQNVCLKVPKIKPVTSLPSSSSDYVPPEPSATPAPDPTSVPK
jgi:hypothetical protein